MSASLRLIILGLAVLALIAASPAAMAGDRDHDGGFFLRLSAGGGAASSEAGGLKLSGTSGDMNFAIGGVVTPNLALHATLFGWLVDEPDVEFGGLSGQMQADLDLTAFGAGVTYYFMPVNLYLSGSVGAGTMTIDTAIGKGETSTGMVMDLTLGKEWWVGGRWGLGAAAAFGYHVIPEDDIEDDWTGTSVALRFTATMN
jgi:hypothetical protein